MKRYILCLLSLMLISNYCFAQSESITGIKEIDDKLLVLSLSEIMDGAEGVLLVNIQLYSEIISMMEDHKLTKHYIYLNLLKGRSEAYSVLGMYEKCSRDIESILSLCRQSNRIDVVIWAYIELSYISVELEEYDKAIFYAQEATEFAKHTQLIPKIVSANIALMDALYAANDYERCEEISKYLLDIYINCCFDNVLYVIYTLNVYTELVGQCYSPAKNYLSSIVKTEQDPYYLCVINNYLANIHVEEDINYAINNYECILNIWNEKYQETKDLDSIIINDELYDLFYYYAEATIALAYIYIDNHNYDKAIELIEPVISLFEEEETVHIVHITSDTQYRYDYYLHLLAIKNVLIFNTDPNYMNNQKYISNTDKICEFINSAIERHKSQLPHMNAFERQKCIGEYRELTDLIFQYSMRAINSAYSNNLYEWQNTAMNSLLFYKGLCLEMERNYTPVSNNTNIGYNMPNMNDIKEITLNNMTIIEFGQFWDNGDNYVGLILRKDWISPKLVYIGKFEELEEYYIKGDKAYNAENSTNLYNFIWSKLEPYINEGDDVYFAPDGLLYQINIEVLQDANGRRANEKWNLYRVSSTRELCMEKPTVDINSAVLYGGLKYTMDDDELLAASRTYSREDMQSATRGFVADSTMRKGWNYLPETKTEVEAIAQMCESYNVRAEIFSETSGNEESFKALSGKKTPIIHLATHGFFYKNEEVTNVPFFNAFNFDQMPQKPDNSLKRSGLILAGGQKAWLGEAIPDSVEDGILLAEEIAMMDLTGTDLVVLSACETGLGEITSEGVFGLQRAFKKAGVQTIIMSLWNVNDLAASLFMRVFYQEWLSGKTKHEAFAIAQNIVRESYEGNDWAAFIMLD